MFRDFAVLAARKKNDAGDFEYTISEDFDGRFSTFDENEDLIVKTSKFDKDLFRETTQPKGYEILEGQSLIILRWYIPSDSKNFEFALANVAKNLDKITCGKYLKRIQHVSSFPAILKRRIFSCNPEAINGKWQYKNSTLTCSTLSIPAYEFFNQQLDDPTGERLNYL